MQTLRQKEKNKATPTLSFDYVNKMTDQTRFWMHETSGTVYVFDQHTSEIFEITDALSDLITADNEREFRTIRSKISEEDIAENAEFLSELFKIEDEPIESNRSKTNVSVLKLNTSSKCNLSCAYCFRDKASNVSIAEPALMYKAIEKMVTGFGRDSESYTVCFNLASEPLVHLETLDKLFVFTKKLQGKIGKTIEIFFITNGTILSDKSLQAIKKIAKDRLVSISIDGPKEVHDSLRRYPDSSGSYDQLVANIRTLRKKGVKLTAEAVITKKHPYPLDILKHLMELGFERVNLKPVRQGTPYSFDDKSIEQLKKGYLDYFSYLTEELCSENYYMLTILAKDYALKPFWRILFNHKMNVRCGWGINSISMDHKGDFYPCDSIMGMEKYRVGNVNDGIDWTRYHVDLDCEKRGNCSSCWARNICGGTCYVNGIIGENDILAIDPIECNLTKFLIESNLKMICDLLNRGADMQAIRTILQINLMDIFKL